MVWTAPIAEPTIQHLTQYKKKKGVEVKTKPNYRNKMLKDRPDIINYGEVFKGCRQERSIPTMAVKKWLTNISARPSVGPLMTGRISVLVK